jgi:hypothetical protein
MVATRRYEREAEQGGREGRRMDGRYVSHAFIFPIHYSLAPLRTPCGTQEPLPSRPVTFMPQNRILIRKLGATALKPDLLNLGP